LGFAGITHSLEAGKQDCLTLAKKIGKKKLKKDGKYQLPTESTKKK
jgi:hypothetical protein